MTGQRKSSESTPEAAKGPSRSTAPASTEGIELVVRGDLYALKIAPGDVIVVRMLRRITAEQAERIREQFTEVLPDNRLLLISPDMEILERSEPEPPAPSRLGTIRTRTVDNG